MKKLFTLIISIGIMLSLFTVTAFAADTYVESGSCGTGVSWVAYDTNKDSYADKLVISGSGYMNRYNNAQVPWWRHKDYIETIEVQYGVESIGAQAFNDFISLTNVSLPSSLNVIEDSAFSNCKKLTKISIPEGVWRIQSYVFSGCQSLKTIFLPKSLEWVDTDGFTYSEIDKVYYAGSKSDWEEIKFYSYGSYIKNHSNIYYRCSAATIITQPESVIVNSGKKATVNLKAKGDGLKYTWYYKDKNKTKFVKTDSVKGNTYSVSMTSARNGRQVYCVVTDKYGNETTSNVVTLSMKGKLLITKQPISVKVLPDQDAQVSVSAAGEGLKYTWYYKDAKSSKFTKTSSFKGSTYSITMNNKRSGRQVYCVIKDKYGNSVKTNVVTLDMELIYPTILIQPKNVGGKVGEVVKTSVEAFGEGLTYTWYYKDKGASKFTKSSTVKGNTYSVQMSKSRDGRQVYCVVKNKYGATVKTDVVTLSMKKQDLKIISQPTSVKVDKGKEVTLTVKAQGDGLRYFWYYKDVGDTAFKMSSVRTSTYSVTMNSSRSGRQIFCEVIDQYNNVAYTNTVTISMTGGEEPNFQASMESTTVSNLSSVVIGIRNNGTKTMRISANGSLISNYSSSYDRDVRLVDLSGSGISYPSYINVKAGEVKYVQFAVNGSNTYYDAKSELVFYFNYDGQSYKCTASYAYGINCTKLS